MIQTYWQTLTEREKLLVSGAGMLLLVTIVYFVIIRPLVAYHTESERAYTSAYAQLQAVRSYASQIRPVVAEADNKTASQQPVNLRVAVSSAARASGVAISRLQPSEDGTLTIWAEQIQSPQLFLWLDTLSKIHSVGPQNVLIQKTSVPGTLRIQLQFSDSAQR